MDSLCSPFSKMHNSEGVVGRKYIGHQLMGFCCKIISGA
jgi:hypothetical protein